MAAMIKLLMINLLKKCLVILTSRITRIVARASCDRTERIASLTKIICVLNTDFDIDKKTYNKFESLTTKEQPSAS